MCKIKNEGNFITINLTPHLSQLVLIILWHLKSAKHPFPLLQSIVLRILTILIGFTMSSTSMVGIWTTYLLMCWSFLPSPILLFFYWCLIGMSDAAMRINDNTDPNWANEVCKWSVKITICSFPYIGKSKELNYIRQISTWGDKGFKSCTIILSQLVLPIQLTATMERVLFTFEVP